VLGGRRERMRQIKFRGKRIDNAEWVYGQYFSFKNSNDNENWIEHYIRNSQDEDIEVDEDTIGQYIGLKDKNRKEIYEGDLFNYGQYLKCEVHYRIGAYWFKNELFGLIGVIAKVYPESLEIIGNIHDNKEKL